MSVCVGLKHRAWEESNNQFNDDAGCHESCINFHEALRNWVTLMLDASFGSLDELLRDVPSLESDDIPELA